MKLTRERQSPHNEPGCKEKPGIKHTLRTRCWQQIIHVNPAIETPAFQAAPAARPADSHHLVRDKRGVRLAEEEAA